MFAAQPAGGAPYGSRSLCNPQGKQILFIYLTNCTAENVIEQLPEVQRVVTAQPRNSMLTLTDLTGAQFSRAAVTRMKESYLINRM